MSWRGNVAALLIIAIASWARAAFLSDLGRATTYLTYYPAVALAALYGGLGAGILATIASALLSYYWILNGSMSPIETLAMWIFVISCTLISGIAEATHRAQAQARREKDKAEAANKAKSEFFARMSHELRTPMNAVLGFSEILWRDAGLTDDQRTTVEIIRRSGEQLLSLIDDALDMAKIDAERIIVNNTTFDLPEMLREAIQLLRVRAEEKHLQLVLDHPTDLPRHVHADATKLRQAIINLIANAIKFTEHGGVTLRVHTQPGDSPRSLLLIIEVEDSGIGIAAADQQRVFDPFVQVARSSSEKSSGLGLAITKKFAELLGGRITLKSTQGHGSTFRMEIPAGLGDVAAAGAPDLVGNVIGLTPGQPEYRILVVEDQPENWLLMRRLLEPVGFKVGVAENGQVGIEMFEAWQPHFIWMDIGMPVMDGLEATRRIRAHKDGRHVKIVAITANVFDEDIGDFRSAGMDDLIRKPYKSKEIFDCLTQHLGVTFVHENAAPASSLVESTEPLTPNAMAGLPQGLRNDLADALLTLDAERIAGVIGRIADTNAGLGRTLQEHASQFNYSAIMRTLKPGAGNTNDNQDQP